MKKITQYIKSNTVRKYIEDNNFELNMVQAAFIVWHNEDIPLKEKIECYEYIANNYEDMSVNPVRCNKDGSRNISSFKDHLHLIIKQLEDDYDEFMKESSMMFYTARQKYKENDCYKTFEECKAILKTENIPWFEPVTREAEYVIYKMPKEISLERPHKTDWDYASLTFDLEVKEIGLFNRIQGIDNPKNIFEYLYIDIPVPFKRGDIVKSWYRGHDECYCIDKMFRFEDIDVKYHFPDCMDFGGYLYDTGICRGEPYKEFAYCPCDNPIYIDLEYVDVKMLKGLAKTLLLSKEHIRREEAKENPLTPDVILEYYKILELEDKGDIDDSSDIEKASDFDLEHHPVVVWL